MVVRSVNKVLSCAARATAWTTGANLNLTELNDVIFKQAKIWFSAGCAGSVEIRILLNGGQLLPDPLNNYSNAYVGSDNDYQIFLGKRLHHSDRLTIEYKNSDYSVHTVSVQYEFQPLPTETVSQVQTVVVPKTATKPQARNVVIPRKPGTEIIPDKDEPERDYVMREPKHGRVGDDSERAYVGGHEDGLPEWLKQDGYPEFTSKDPRKPRLEKS